MCMHTCVCVLYMLGQIFCLFLFLFIFFMHETWFLELVVDLEVYSPVPTARFAAQL